MKVEGGEGRSKRRRPIRVGAIVMREGKALAIRHAHPDPETEYWVLPGGGLEPGETPMECAVRELLEETLLEATAVRLACVIDQPHRKGRELSLYFICDPKPGAAEPAAELKERDRGFTHELVWIEPEQLAGKRLFPVALRDAFADGSLLEDSGPFVYFEE